MKKMIVDKENPNGITVDLTAEEIAEVNTIKASILAEAKVEANKVAKRKVDAKEGNDKLVALGLSQDQVTAMTGYTPPVEEKLKG